MTTPASQSFLRKHLGLVLLSLATVLVLAAGITKYLLCTADYPIYAAAGQRMLHGEPVYLPGGDPRQPGAPFTYPPFLALLFIPLSTLPWAAQKVLWFLLSLAGLLVVVRYVARQLAPVLDEGRRRRAVPPWLFWLLVAALVGRYVLAGFEMQSNDVVVIVLLTLSIVAGCGRHEARSGIWAGLAAACKATPLLFGPVFVWQRRWKAAVLLGGATLVATFLPDVLAPSQDGRPWVASWYDVCLRQIRPGDTAQAEGAWPKWNKLNQSLAGTLYRLSEPPPADSPDAEMDARIWSPGAALRTRTTLALQLAVMAILAWGTWPRRAFAALAPQEQAVQRFGEGGAVICAMLLLSPMSSKAHFAALLLPVAFCMAHFLYRRRDPWLAAAFVVMLLISSMTVKGIWGTTLGDKILARGSVCWTALLCLLITVRVLRDRLRTAQPATTAAEASPAIIPAPHCRPGVEARQKLKTES